MTRVVIERWAGLAPGLELGEESWRAWARAPQPFPGGSGREGEGNREVEPDVKFLPAMQRRRCDLLSRMMLAVANACCDESERAELLSVFASRHGSFGTTVAMLEALAADEPLSPTQFSHSVHNTQVGLFSIWSGNQQVAQSLASRNESFEHGVLEAVCLQARSGGRPVLLVTGDEALPEPVAALSDDPHPPYAVGLLLRAGGAGDALDFSLEHEPEALRATHMWPKAIEFLRWWLNESGEESALTLGEAPRAFVFRRQPKSDSSSQNAKKLNH